MSIRIMSAVFENETLKPTEKLILLALADHADDTGRCYPSIGRLAKRTCLSERAMQTNIRSLEDQGYITIHKGGGRENTNVYFVKANPAGNAPIEKGNPAAPALNPAAPALNPAAYAPEPSITIKEPSENILPRKRKCQLPENWVPSDKNIEDAQEQNLSQQEISHNAKQFRDHHLAKGSTMLDWDAAWRTWCRNSRKWGSSQRGNTGSRSPHQQLFDAFQSVAAERSAGTGFDDFGN